MTTIEWSDVTINIKKMCFDDNNTTPVFDLRQLLWTRSNHQMDGHLERDWRHSKRRKYTLTESSWEGYSSDESIISSNSLDDCSENGSNSDEVVVRGILLSRNTSSAHNIIVKGIPSANTRCLQNTPKHEMYDSQMGTPNQKI